MPRARLLGVLTAAACGEPAVELSFQMPPPQVAAEFDTSCVSAVGIYLDGANYPDDDDWTYDCVELEGGHATYADIEAALRGQIAVDIPDSGLLGVELYGYDGPCDVDNELVYDLIFHGGAEYDGGGSLAIPVLPNLGCALSDVAVRPVDILKLSATRDCAQAAVPAGKMASGSLSQLILTDELYWWGGLSSGDIANGVAAFRARTKIGSGVLTMTHVVDGAAAALSPRPPAAQQVCATGVEIEAATLPLAVARASQDPVKLAESGAVAFVLVYGAAGPVEGATVTVRADQRDLVDIVYLDMPAGVESGTGALVARAGTATGPSGLVAVYTGAMVDLTVTAAGRSVQRKLATATDQEPSVPPVAQIMKL